jgi:hypothetical protein
MALYLNLPGNPHEPEYEAALRRRISSSMLVAGLNIAIFLFFAITLPARWSIYFWVLLVGYILISIRRVRALYRLYDVPPFPANLAGLDLAERQRQVRNQIRRTLLILVAVLAYVAVSVALFWGRQPDLLTIVIAIAAIVYVIARIVALQNLMNPEE